MTSESVSEEYLRSMGCRHWGGMLGRVWDQMTLSIICSSFEVSPRIVAEGRGEGLVEAGRDSEWVGKDLEA